jgi:predicted phosphodiesterase
LTAKYVQAHFKATGEDVYELVTFDITEGSDIRYTVYGTTFVLTHGDQFRGGSGIASALSPLMIGDHRKRKRQQSIGNPYDWLIMGHWHQLMLGMMGIIVNGSLVGYNEYAYQKNLPFEQPQQAFWLTDPEHGVTLRAPIHVKEE